MGLFDKIKSLTPEAAVDILNALHHHDLKGIHRISSKSGDNFVLLPEEKFKDHLNAFHTALNAFYNDYGSPDKD